jgi:hypothetical protein
MRVSVFMAERVQIMVFSVVTVCSFVGGFHVLKEHTTFIFAVGGSNIFL